MQFTAVLWTWLRRLLCLILCVSLLLGAPAPKAEALALESGVAIGVIACLILMSVGVVFNPQTQEDLQAIGQNFQSYMYQWGTSAEKLDEVETWFSGLHLIDPDDDDNWRPDKTKIRLARGLLTGISLWCASIMLGLRKVENPAVPSGVGFSVASINLQISGGRERFMWEDTTSWYNCLYSAYGGKQAIIYGCNDNYLFGYFWDDAGVFSSGLWRNSLGQPHSSLLGVYGLADLELFESIPATEIPLYFDKSIAESQPGSLYSSCLVPDWSTLYKDTIFSCYVKNASDSTWAGGKEDHYYGLRVSLFDADPNYATISFPASTDSVVWVSLPSYIDSPGIVGGIAEDLEYGHISEEQLPLYDLNYGTLLPDVASPLESVQDLGSMLVAGTLTLDEYLEMGQAADPGSVEPVWTQDIPLGSAVEYEQNSIADPVEVLASVDDGGTISYEWYRYGTDPDGNVYPVEVLETGPVLVPQTAELGTSYYYCQAYNTSESGLVSFRVASSAIAVTVVPAAAVDPDPGTDPDPGGDSDTDEGVEAGQDFVDQLQDVIPNYSEGFGNALSEFGSNFSYEGTEAILTIPALRFPEIPGKVKGEPLIKEYVLMEEQKVDFAEYVDLVPNVILTLVRCLLTGALILFCVKEFYGIVAYILTLRKEG